MYQLKIEPIFFTQISSAFISDDPKQNEDIRKKALNRLGADIIFSLTLLEDHFVGACISFNRLKNRDDLYRQLLTQQSPAQILRDPLLKELHSDEYFFFCSCGYIFKELCHETKHSNLRIPNELYDKLKILNEERRVREHGKEWFWGEKGNIVPSKGDNYDFESNMQLLVQIYKQIVKQLVTK